MNKQEINVPVFKYADVPNNSHLVSHGFNGCFGVLLNSSGGNGFFMHHPFFNNIWDKIAPKLQDATEITIIKPENDSVSQYEIQMMVANPHLVIKYLNYSGGHRNKVPWSFEADITDGKTVTRLFKKSNVFVNASSLLDAPKSIATNTTEFDR